MRKEIEWALLGRLIATPGLNDEFHLTPENFTDGNFIIAESIKRLTNSGQKVDVFSVLRTIQESFVDYELRFISDIVEWACKPDQVARHIELVNEHGSKANLINKVMGILQDEGATAESILGKISDLAADHDNAHSDDWVTLPELYRDAIQEYEDRINAGGKLAGHTIGISEFDNGIGSLQGGGLYIIAGRAAMGKTALAMHIANQVSKDVPVAVFALEMGKLQTGFRLLSSATGATLEELQRGKNPNDNWERISVAVALVQDRKQYWDFSDNPSVSKMKRKCSRLQRKHGLGAIIVDYLQLMDGDGDDENRTQEMSRISRGLKRMAKSLNVPVIALSQLSRACEQRADKRPQLSDLRESGAIEQDADVVIAAWRPHYYWPDKPENFFVGIVLKNRQGKTSDIPMSCDLSTQRFGAWAGGDPMEAIQPQKKTRSFDMGVSGYGNN